MPRNVSGTFTLPLPPVVPDTIIESGWANDTLNDIAQALTDSLDRTGRGGLTGPFRLVDGTAAQPAWAFNSETSTGMYKAGTGQLAVSVLGTAVAGFESGAFNVLTPFKINIGGTEIFTMNASAAWSTVPINVPWPTADGHATPKVYVDTRFSNAPGGGFLPLAGGTLTGALFLTTSGYTYVNLINTGAPANSKNARWALDNGGNIALGLVNDANNAFVSGLRVAPDGRLYDMPSGGRLLNTTDSAGLSVSYANSAGYATNAGNAANATNANYATNAGNADTVDGYHASVANNWNQIPVRDPSTGGINVGAINDAGNLTVAGTGEFQNTVHLYNAANLKLWAPGNGSGKSLRCNNNYFEIVNNAYNEVIASLADDGLWNPTRGYASRQGNHGAVGNNHWNYYYEGPGLVRIWIDSTPIGWINVSTSDERVKKDIAPMPLLPEEVFNAIVPIKFRWRDVGDGVFTDDGRDHWGLSAQNILKQVPTALLGDVTEVDPEGRPRPAGIDPMAILGQLVLQVQSILRRIQRTSDAT